MTAPQRGISDDALKFCRNGGCRPELAWTCHDFAELLLERGASGDHDRASELLHEALLVGAGQSPELT
jgi:hypothetical protein